MARTLQTRALALFLLIPVIGVVGMALANAVNPEIAARFGNYERNFRLLTLARMLIILATLVTVTCMWLLTCVVVVKSKRRSTWWVLLSMLGPFGFVALAGLRDASSPSHPAPSPFIHRLNLSRRIVYEVAAFIVIWVVAFQGIEVLHDITTRYQAATTGVPVAQITQVQNASSGMWAFGEGMEALYGVVLLYLLRPFCLAVLDRLRRPSAPIRS